ncbi:MAG: kynureninase [Bacteroidia bacterium]
MLRNLFYLPEREKGVPWVYFCGHSLGAQPKATRSYLDRVLDTWAKKGVGGYFSGNPSWIDYPEVICAKVAPWVGAPAETIALFGTLSVNLQHLLVSFYRPTPKRYRILMEEKPFPTDVYAAQSYAALLGYQEAIDFIPVGQLEEVLQSRADRYALVLLPGVQYYTGEVLDIGKLTALAQAGGCIVGWDLAHAVGNVAVGLYASGADFAVWCSYKYLNAGPASIAGMYVHPKHWGKVPLLAGWWGHKLETRFSMPLTFEPISDVRAWVPSAPSPLQLAVLEASLDIFAQLEPERYFMEVQRFHDALREAVMHPLIEILTPAHARGAQVSFRIHHPQAKRVFDQLLEEGFFVDWREPGAIRASAVPLYNTLEEIQAFGVCVQRCISSLA